MSQFPPSCVNVVVVEGIRTWNVKKKERMSGCRTEGSALPAVKSLKGEGDWNPWVCFSA